MRAMKRMKILLRTRMMEASLPMIQGKENLMAVTMERRKRYRSKRNSRKSFISRHRQVGKKLKMVTKMGQRRRNGRRKGTQMHQRGPSAPLCSSPKHNFVELQLLVITLVVLILQLRRKLHMKQKHRLIKNVIAKKSRGTRIHRPQTWGWQMNLTVSKRLGGRYITSEVMLPVYSGLKTVMIWEI